VPDSMRPLRNYFSLLFILQSLLDEVVTMFLHGIWRRMQAEGRLRYVCLYLLCVMIVAQQTSATESSTSDDDELSGAVAQPVLRNAFSVTHDLQTLTEMLRQQSARRRMQNAEAFFNALHKRRKQQPSQDTGPFKYRPVRWI